MKSSVNWVAQAEACGYKTFHDLRVGQRPMSNYYLAGGFGWSRTMDIDPSKFKYPRLVFRGPPGFLAGRPLSPGRACPFGKDYPERFDKPLPQSFGHHIDEIYYGVI